MDATRYTPPTLKRLTGACLFLCSALTSALLHADSSVWKTSKGGESFYIGGTVHMLAASDHPLPAPFDVAYAEADVLVFETDMAAMESPEFQMKSIQAMTYQDGRMLQGALNEATYNDLSAFLESRGINAAQFSMFTPAGVGLMLVVMEYQRMGLVPTYGVDSTYYQRAVTDQKNLLALETPDEQLSFIAHMADGKENEMIAYTLRDISRLPDYFGMLKTAWREGDLKSMEKAALADIRKEFPQMHQRLIVDRNNNWLREMDTMITTEEVEFILVGALHLAGDEGVIAQLKKKGFSVKQVDAK